MGSIGLKWLYNQRRLDLRPIVEGPTTFTTIQATELEDPTEFTAPGAIILTVGLAFNGAAAGFPAYAARLKAAGIQGIGFGTGLGFRTIPQQLIAAAQQEGLALFEVPRAIAFNSIINTVSSELVRSENNQQFALHRRQEALNKAAAFGIDHLVAQASQELDAAIALAASDGTTISSHPRHSLDALPDAISVATDPEASTSGAQSRTLKDGTTVATITNAFRIQEHQRFGLAASAPLKFDSYARALVRHLVGLAGLLLRESDSSRQQMLGALTLAAQLNSPAAGPDLRAQLARSFATLTHTDQVALCLISAESSAHLDKALQALAAGAAAKGMNYFAFPMTAEPGATTIPATPLPPAQPAPPDCALLAFSPHIELSTLAQLFRRFSASVRVAYTEPVHWNELTGDLVAALRTQAQSQRLGTTGLLDESGPVWLHSPAVRSALETRYRLLLGELVAYDGAHHTELLPTLRAYLLADAHLGHTATELGVHRHTVRSRIEKIQELCSLDLSDPLTRAEVLLLCISPPSEH
ncbi:helix-turn-helix domain-containing protein [Corynebacterium flavescens]|uniref:helix-turn-helix domain-containing protein n=1 Tax=Corynebacterium flavescens TaxID=28028 RepID=UPI003FCFB6F7